tara:strand:+ start:294 stop:557 length:264 start_codon:yes stop_codon:yes gene_type:complete
MTKQIFITVTQRGYTDSTDLLGPFTSIEEGKRLETDSETHGLDGDETRYTFWEVTESGTKEVGYVLFKDECEYDDENLKEEYFRDNP